MVKGKEMRQASENPDEKNKREYLKSKNHQAWTKPQMEILQALLYLLYITNKYNKIFQAEINRYLQEKKQQISTVELEAKEIEWKKLWENLNDLQIMTQRDRFDR